MKLQGPGSKMIKNYRMEITELQCWVPGTPLRSGCLLQSQPCWGRRSAKKPAPTQAVPETLHTQVDLCTLTHTQVCIYVFRHMFTFAHMHTHIQTHVHICIPVSRHMFAFAHMLTCVYMHAHTCTSIRYCPFTGIVTGLAWLCPPLCVTDSNLAGFAFMSSPHAEV